MHGAQAVKGSCMVRAWCMQGIVAVVMRSIQLHLANMQSHIQQQKLKEA